MLIYLNFIYWKISYKISFIFNFNKYLIPYIIDYIRYLFIFKVKSENRIFSLKFYLNKKKIY